ncbi:MAG: phenylalanine--tRNA ligase beta subunit-related protein [Candidatus Cloacimonadales bacterium]|nr:phenylalanine--tRNA ligase beta subunit-related protein [Candidatus Cloacimonadales bacterium]
MWKIEPNTPLKLGVIIMKNVSVTAEKTAYNKILDCAAEYARKYQNTNIGEIPGVMNSRSLFRSIGMDPTKHRPSSEALLRRALKGLEYFSINTLVDIGNWCSLDFLLPICVYDADKTAGEITARLGKENESYFGHNNREVNLHNRYLIADEKGPFGSPITDSIRTAVDINTRNAILIIFTPQDFADELLQKQMEIFAERVQEICGGKIVESFVLKSN